MRKWVVSLLFLTTSLCAQEVRTYVVNLSSVPDTSIFTTKGLQRQKQPLLNAKISPIKDSRTCMSLEIAYSNNGEKNFLDTSASDGSIILIETTQYLEAIDPRGGDLVVTRTTNFIGNIPSYCFDVVVSTTKGG